jgi:hypothetical protein
MQLLFSATLLLTLAIACTDSMSEREALISRIEAKLVLPEGANSIDTYSRNYAFTPDGKVIAIYVTPFVAATREGPDYGCEVMLEDFESRSCTDDEISEMKHQDVAAVELFGAADQSRWFNDYLELPSISDGGCMQIEIVFDPQAQRIERARCNGSV